MEKIVLIRKEKLPNRTFGEMWFNNKMLCYTLEDGIRDCKIKHRTAICEGVYEVLITMSSRFKQKMPLLLDVPDFEGIRIHKGNFADYEVFLKEVPVTKSVFTKGKIRVTITKKNEIRAYGVSLAPGKYTIENTGKKYRINTLLDNTSGCVLVGTKRTDNCLLDSAEAYTIVYSLIEGLLKKGKVYIEVRSETPKVEPKIAVTSKISIVPITVEQPVTVDLITVDTIPVKENIIIKLLKTLIQLWKTLFSHNGSR